MQQTDQFYDLLKQIGDKCYIARHTKKEKTITVGKNIGVSHAVISRIENGSYRSLSLKLLCRLADYYGYDIKDLLEKGK